jgi:protoheme IX farnesyltransferase
MFALEGTVANAYLLYLTRRFTGDRSNGNARAVFLCSLWYLPLLLTAFVLHSTDVHTQSIANTAVVGSDGVLMQSSGVETEDAATRVKSVVKSVLRDLCVHEQLTSKQNQSTGGLCVKLKTDQVCIGVTVACVVM